MKGKKREECRKARKRGSKDVRGVGGEGRNVDHAQNL